MREWLILFGIIFLFSNVFAVVYPSLTWDLNFDYNLKAGLSSGKIAIDSSGNFYIGGNDTNINCSPSCSGSGTGQDWRIRKLSQQGTVLWDYNYDGNFGADTLKDVLIASDGNLILVGYSTNINGLSNIDWRVMKVYPDGVKIWDKNWTSAGNNGDYLLRGILASDGNIYLAGYGFNFGTPTSGADWWIKKINQNGVQIWDRNYNSVGANSIDSASSIVEGIDGNFFIAGYGQNMNGSSSLDLWLKKIDPNGNTIWDWNRTSTRSLASSTDFLYDACPSSDGNIYIVGSGRGLASGSSNADVWVTKLNSNRTILWDYNWNGSNSNDYALGCAMGLDGNLYVAGYGANLNGTSGEDWIMFSINPNGTKNWDRNYTTAGNNSDRLYSANVALDGNVYFIGYGTNMQGSSSSDWWVKKIAVQDSNYSYGDSSPPADPCAPTLNADWTISTTITCTSKTINIGTGKLITATGGKLYLINSTLTCNQVKFGTTGDQLYIGTGSQVKIG